MPAKLTHLSPEGTAAMVDVSHKPMAAREAVAESFISLQPGTIALIESKKITKGEVLAVARIAGIQAAKQTSQLIPLCHPLPLTHCAMDFEVQAGGIRIAASVRTTAPTGVEMEALTAASIAGLTIYDMCKAVDKSMALGPTRLLLKNKAPAG